MSLNPYRPDRQCGFTLIELLIVVAMIAVLAGIAVPNFLEAQVRAKVAGTSANAASMAMALEAYRVDLGDYPPNYAALFWRDEMTSTGLEIRPWHEWAVQDGQPLLPVDLSDRIAHLFESPISESRSRGYYPSTGRDKAYVQVGDRLEFPEDIVLFGSMLNSYACQAALMGDPDAIDRGYLGTSSIDAFGRGGKFPLQYMRLDNKGTELARSWGIEAADGSNPYILVSNGPDASPPFNGARQQAGSVPIGWGMESMDTMNPVESEPMVRFADLRAEPSYDPTNGTTSAGALYFSRHGRSH